MTKVFDLTKAFIRPRQSSDAQYALRQDQEENPGHRSRTSTDV